MGSTDLGQTDPAVTLQGVVCVLQEVKSAGAQYRRRCVFRVNSSLTVSG